MIPITDDAKVEAFHRHCDECSQCMNNPFELCPKGAALLLATAKGGER